MRTDKTDALAEAEVYLAYGRESEARALLEEALKSDPSREDIRRMLASLPAAKVPPRVSTLREALRTAFLLMTPTLFVVFPGSLLLIYAMLRGGWPIGLAGLLLVVVGLVWQFKLQCRLEREGRIVIKGAWMRCPRAAPRAPKIP